MIEESSKGFVEYFWKPASKACCRLSLELNALKAIAGTKPPSLAGNCRILETIEYPSSSGIPMSEIITFGNLPIELLRIVYA